MTQSCPENRKFNHPLSLCRHRLSLCSARSARFTSCLVVCGPWSELCCVIPPDVTAGHPHHTAEPPPSPDRAMHKAPCNSQPMKLGCNMQGRTREIAVEHAALPSSMNLFPGLSTSWKTLQTLGSAFQCDDIFIHFSWLVPYTSSSRQSGWTPLLSFATSRGLPSRHSDQPWCRRRRIIIRCKNERG